MEGGARQGAVPIETANYTKCKYVKKRRIRKQARINKLVIAGANDYVLRCQAYNQYANANGGIYVVSANQVNATDVGTYLPMWLFDTTAAMNWSTGPSAASANLTFGEVVYRPFVRNTGPPANNITFTKNRNSFYASDGTNIVNDYGHQLEYTPQNLTSQQNGFLMKAFHRYTQIHMLCYGTTNFASRWSIGFVRFHKEHLTPGWWDTGNVGANSGGLASNLSEQMSETVALYQHLAAPFMYSPLQNFNFQMRRDYTYVPVKEFTMGFPAGAVAGTTVPFMHEVKIFKEHNTIRNYAWRDQFALSGVRSQINGPAVQFPATFNRSAPNVDYTSRWYLIVRAQSTGFVQGDIFPAPSTSTSPSFDFMMRNKYTEII